MKPQDTRKVERLLKDSGFKPVSQSGSHVKFQNSNNGKSIILTNTRQQSPGISRQIQTLLNVRL